MCIHLFHIIFFLWVKQNCLTVVGFTLVPLLIAMFFFLFFILEFAKLEQRVSRKQSLYLYGPKPHLWDSTGTTEIDLHISVI